MSGANFADLDRKSIAISLEIGERTIVLKGIASFDVDETLGGVLRIPIHDAAGDFELILNQPELQAEILEGAEFGCDYFLAWGSNCPAIAGSC